MAEIHLAGARAIDAAVRDAIRRHKGPTNEPHLIAAIFRNHRFRKAIIDAIDPLWQAVRAHTVFVHQKPMVEFTCDVGIHQCELGDGLVVYRERLRAGQLRHQAVLFQAKRWVGAERRWVKLDPDQHALYRHWPPFTIAGGPPGEIRLPPGDYGRVLGLTARWGTNDVPRVSTRRPTEPGCAIEHPVWEETIGTIGRAIRGVVRFEVGERVQGAWETVVADAIRRVSLSSPGQTFPEGPRGGSAERGDVPPSDATEVDDQVDNLFDTAFAFRSTDKLTDFANNGESLPILLIDSVEPG